MRVRRCFSLLSDPISQRYAQLAERRLQSASEGDAVGNAITQRAGTFFFFTKQPNTGEEPPSEPLYTTPMPVFRNANGKWRSLRFSGCVFLLSAAASIVTRGFALPCFAWLLMSAGVFMLSPSEQYPPPVKSKGLILIYGVGLAGAGAGAILLLVDLASKSHSGK